MSRHQTVTAALATMPPDKSAWLVKHCRKFNHDLSNAISISATYRAAPDFSTWCAAIASRLRTDKKYQQHGKINRNYLKNLEVMEIDDELQSASSLALSCKSGFAFSDPLEILSALEGVEEFFDDGIIPDLTTKQISDDLGVTHRHGRNLKRKAFEKAKLGDLFGGFEGVLA